LPGQVLSMGELGWQPRSAEVEPREADAEGMGVRAVFEPRKAGRLGSYSSCTSWCANTTKFVNPVVDSIPSGRSVQMRTTE
jgi:hypothetical protein